MPKLPVLSGAEVCAVLAKHGFERIRQKGSHIIMQRLLGDDSTTVPVPDHDEVRRGTLRSIIRQSGLAREDFENS